MMLNKSEAKYIQSLSQKKFREAQRIFVVEGPKIVNEALRAENLQIEKIYAIPQWIAAHRSAGEKLTIVEVSEHELQRISQLKTPNQVLALLRLPNPQEAVVRSDAFTLVLDGIQDPGNLGTIIRMADWFGIPQVVCSPDCADAWNSKVVQATMGSIFRVRVYYTELKSWLGAQQHIPVYGAALQGTPLRQLQKIKGGILVIGNESKGIREELLPLLQEKITIERTGTAESLNAAVATGILLYQLGA